MRLNPVEKKFVFRTPNHSAKVFESSICSYCTRAPEFDHEHRAVAVSSSVLEFVLVCTYNLNSFD